jgi:hypothetical protein
METIAAIVEGHTEEHFVRSTYGAVLISRAIPNGRTVPAEVIVEAIVDALELIGGQITKVLILFDREGRAATAESLAQVVREGVAARCGERSLYVGVADKQIENWIIADEQEMRRRYDPSFGYSGDGSGGKAILQRLTGVSLGPRDTAQLLKACSARRASEKSASLAALIGSVDFQWQWAQA